MGDRLILVVEEQHYAGALVSGLKAVGYRVMLLDPRRGDRVQNVCSSLTNKVSLVIIEPDNFSIDEWQLVAGALTSTGKLLVVLTEGNLSIKVPVDCLLFRKPIELKGFIRHIQGIFK